MVSRPTPKSLQQRATPAAQAAAQLQEARHFGGPTDAASGGIRPGATPAERRPAETPAAVQQASASPQRAQQAAAQAGTPVNLPPSMLAIAAALPPAQQQNLVRLASSMPLPLQVRFHN